MLILIIHSKKKVESFSLYHNKCTDLHIQVHFGFNAMHKGIKSNHTVSLSYSCDWLDKMSLSFSVTVKKGDKQLIFRISFTFTELQNILKFYQ